MAREAFDPASLIGLTSEHGPVTVTADMVAAYARAVGDDVALARAGEEAPALFCLTLRHDMMPDVQLPPGMFGVYGGHDLELFAPVRVGGVYRSAARIVDVFRKSGRTGVLTVVVREVTIRDDDGQVVARVRERQIVRARPDAAASDADAADAVD
jgi:acyl dehydratase